MPRCWLKWQALQRSEGKRRIWYVFVNWENEITRRMELCTHWLGLQDVVPAERRGECSPELSFRISTASTRTPSWHRDGIVTQRICAFCSELILRSIWSICFFGKKKSWMALYFILAWTLACFVLKSDSLTLRWVSRHTEIPIEHGNSRDLDLTSQVNSDKMECLWTIEWLPTSSNHPNELLSEVLHQHFTIPRYKSQRNQSKMWKYLE